MFLQGISDGNATCPDCGNEYYKRIANHVKCDDCVTKERRSAIRSLGQQKVIFSGSIKRELNELLIERERSRACLACGVSLPSFDLTYKYPTKFCGLHNAGDIRKIFLKNYEDKKSMQRNGIYR